MLDNYGHYSHHLLAIVKPPYVGLAIYGVLTGGLLALAIYCRVKKLPVLRVLDCLALAIPVGQIIGRCANIVNGDTWGSPTRLPWGFVYTNPHALLPADLLGVPTHPTPVYEQLWLVVMVAILWYAVPRLKTDGMAILLYLGLYSFGRFFISFYRVNNILLLGLREAQIVALVVLVAVVPAALAVSQSGAAQLLYPDRQRPTTVTPCLPSARRRRQVPVRQDQRPHMPWSQGAAGGRSRRSLARLRSHGLDYLCSMTAYTMLADEGWRLLKCCPGPAGAR